MLLLRPYYVGMPHTDMTLLSADGTAFPCHRVVVLSRSIVLEAMMSSDFVEARSAQVRLPCEPQVVRAFLGFLYANRIEGQAANSFEDMRVRRLYLLIN